MLYYIKFYKKKDSVHKYDSLPTFCSTYATPTYPRFNVGNRSIAGTLGTLGPAVKGAGRIPKQNIGSEMSHLEGAPVPRSWHI